MTSRRLLSLVWSAREPLLVGEGEYVVVEVCVVGIVSLPDLRSRSDNAVLGAASGLNRKLSRGLVRLGAPDSFGAVRG
jgi:hypothetical protein